MSSKRICFSVVFLVIVAGVWSCAPTVDQTARAGSTDSGARPAVFVENRHRSDIVVYGSRGGLVVRLGMVPSMQSRTFTLSAALVGASAGIRLIADPIGSGERYASPAIRLHAGDQIHWGLASQLSLSSLYVR